MAVNVMCNHYKTKVKKLRHLRQGHQLQSKQITNIVYCIKQSIKELTFKSFFNYKTIFVTISSGWEINFF